MAAALRMHSTPNGLENALSAPALWIRLPDSITIGAPWSSPPPAPPFQGPRTAAGSRARRGGPPPMPGLVVFQHRWHVGADDLYLLAALSLLTNGLFLVAGAFP